MCIQLGLQNHMNPQWLSDVLSANDGTDGALPLRRAPLSWRDVAVRFRCQVRCLRLVLQWLTRSPICRGFVVDRETHLVTWAPNHFSKASSSSSADSIASRIIPFALDTAPRSIKPDQVPRKEVYTLYFWHAPIGPPVRRCHRASIVNVR